MSQIFAAAVRMKNDLQARIDRLPHVNPRFQQALVEYFAWLYLREGKPDNQFSTDWAEFGDLLTAKSNDGRFRSRLMSLEMDRAGLRAENQRYHHQLALNTREFKFNKGPDGLPVVNVQEAVKSLRGFVLIRRENLEFLEDEKVSWQPEVWAGWNWVSLGCGYSSAEGAAAGHCGNSGRRSGDNILSLRDPLNRVHLTFVVNNGTLTEMKAPGNTKPTKLYHPAILALFFSGLVNNIDENHVYELEHNFKLSDLDDALQQMVAGHWVLLQPEKPANLYDASYLEQYTQEKVNGLSNEEKKQLVRIFTGLL